MPVPGAMRDPFPWKPQPDYQRLLKALRRQGNPGCVPFLELFADPEIIAAIAGGPVIYKQQQVSDRRVREAALDQRVALLARARLRRAVDRRRPAAARYVPAGDRRHSRAFAWGAHLGGRKRRQNYELARIRELSLAARGGGRFLPTGIHRSHPAGGHGYGRPDLRDARTRMLADGLPQPGPGIVRPA